MKQKLPASTLIEVVTALGLIATVFVIGSMLWLNLVKSGPVQAFRAQAHIREWIMQPVQSYEVGKQEKLLGGWRLERIVSQHPLSDEIFVVQLSCFQGEKLVESRSRIIYPDEN